MPSESHYDYLGNIHRGDRVEVSIHRDFRDAVFGEVISVSQMCVDILYTDRELGRGLYKFCWHADDPRLDIPGRLEEAQARNSTRDGVIFMAIFRLTHMQKLINELPRRLQSLEERMARLEAKSFGIEGAQPRKKRGRPPKAKTVTAPPEEEFQGLNL